MQVSARVSPNDLRSELFEKKLKSMPVLKSISQTVLSFIYMANDFPKICERIAPHRIVPIVLSLKPYETTLTTIKDVGTFVDLPEKLYGVRPASLGETPNNWVSAHKVLSALQTTIEAVLLIPHTWNWIDLGNLSLNFGHVEIVKDCFALGAAVCKIAVSWKELGEGDDSKLRIDIVYNSAKIAAIVMHNSVKGGLALLIVANFGCSLVMAELILYLGRCAANFATGIFGFQKTQVQILC